MTKKYLKFSDYLVESLKDPAEAEAFLSAAITAYEEDGDTASFMLALRYLTEAKGGIKELSKKTRLNRTNLYKVLTGKTQPKLTTTISIISKLGFHLAPKAIKRRDDLKHPM